MRECRVQKGIHSVPQDVDRHPPHDAVWCGASFLDQLFGGALSLGPQDRLPGVEVLEFKHREGGNVLRPAACAVDDRDAMGLGRVPDS